MSKAPILRISEYRQSLLQNCAVGLVGVLIYSFFVSIDLFQALAMGVVAGFVYFTIQFFLFRGRLNLTAAQLNQAAYQRSIKRLDGLVGHSKINYSWLALKVAIGMLLILWLIPDLRDIQPSFRLWCALLVAVLMHSGFERGRGIANRILHIVFIPCLFAGFYVCQKTNPFTTPMSSAWIIFGLWAAYVLLSGIANLLIDSQKLKHGYVIDSPPSGR